MRFTKGVSFGERVWVMDPLDYFLISVFIGSLGASLSEKAAMERLKKSVISKIKNTNFEVQEIQNKKDL